MEVDCSSVSARIANGKIHTIKIPALPFFLEFSLFNKDSFVTKNAEITISKQPKKGKIHAKF